MLDINPLAAGSWGGMTGKGTLKEVDILTTDMAILVLPAELHQSG